MSRNRDIVRTDTSDYSLMFEAQFFQFTTLNKSWNT